MFVDSMVQGEVQNIRQEKKRKKNWSTLHASRKSSEQSRSPRVASEQDLLPNAPTQGLHGPARNPCPRQSFLTPSGHAAQLMNAQVSVCPAGTLSHFGTACKKSALGKQPGLESCTSLLWDWITLPLCPTLLSKGQGLLIEPISWGEKLNGIIHIRSLNQCLLLALSKYQNDWPSWAFL